VNDTGAARTVRVRGKRKPGHCWQDNELYDVFQPVIGATATHIFAAMTRWAFGHRVEMGVREIAVESGTSRSAVQRATLAMERLGMLRIDRRRGSEPSAYDLLDLKESSIALGAEWSPQRASHVLPPTRVRELREELQRSVPYGDAKAGGNLPDCVPHEDAAGTVASHTGTLVSQAWDAHPFKEQDTKLQDYPPLPLPPAGGERRVEPEFSDGALKREAERVRQATGASSVGVLRAICAQLVQRVRPATAEGLARTADSMIRGWQDYRTCGDRGWLRFVWGPRKFFADGHWAQSQLWPIDQEREQAYWRAREGAPR
jgi:hypothetical protein